MMTLYLIESFLSAKSQEIDLIAELLCKFFSITPQAFYLLSPYLPALLSF
jgi:hypothetical protein